jgi:hypothetical protein
MKCLLKNWKIGAYFGSIVLAVGIGMFWTMPKEKNDLEEQPVRGKALCNYNGYTSVVCRNSTYTTGCTSGTFKAARVGDEGKGDFRKIIPHTYGNQGNCAGSADCITPSYPNLTSTGCSGG